MNLQICLCAFMYIHSYMDIHTFTYGPTIKLAEFTMAPEVHMRIVRVFCIPISTKGQVLQHHKPFSPLQQREYIYSKNCSMSDVT